MKKAKKAINTTKNRGTKAIKSGDRGGLMLKTPSQPCCILEPFFGSNWQDWITFADQEGTLSQAIALGIKEWSDEHVL